MHAHQTLRPLVLRKLARWRRLTYGDLAEMLPDEWRPHFSESVLRQLEVEGLVSARRAGDEQVLTLTDEGSRWLERNEQG